MAALRRDRPRKAIAERLKKARIAAGITMETAATRLDISRSQWCQIEHGLQSIPAERLVDFAGIVKTTISELLGV